MKYSTSAVGLLLKQKRMRSVQQHCYGSSFILEGQRLSQAMQALNIIPGMLVLI